MNGRKGDCSDQHETQARRVAHDAPASDFRDLSTKPTHDKIKEWKILIEKYFLVFYSLKYFDILSFRLKLFPFYHRFLFLAPTRRKWGENCVSQTNMADRKCGCKGIRSCLLCEGINTQNTDIITWVRIFYIEF